MGFPFSDIGQRISTPSGIEQLMDDLGHALSTGGDEMRMLGGGNPAAIPEVMQLWRQRMHTLLTDTPDRFDRMLVNYDPCRGNPQFLRTVAHFFNRQYGWKLTEDNIAITNGAQTAFFYLINLLAGDTAGQRRKILLPLIPEYIGYANQGICGDSFRAVKPTIEQVDEATFKYHVDFDAIDVTDDVAAICVSRPTNPTGNVLTDQEIDRLSELARKNGIPLIVDNAYGAPFPNIVFRDIKPPWDDHIILTFSLSKVGLPGTRTGIVIAPPQITRAISSINAIASLANNNIGQVLALDLLENDRLAEVSQQIIQPFYRRKSDAALAMLRECMPKERYLVHVSEGALFLWIRLQLPITTATLYERLKQRKVLVVPGEYFFYGLDEPWPHRHECIRLSFAMPDDVVRQGIEVLAAEVRSMQ